MKEMLLYSVSVIKKILLYSVYVFLAFLFSAIVALGAVSASWEGVDMTDIISNWEGIGIALVIGIPIWGSIFIFILLILILIMFIRYCLQIRNFNKKKNI